MEDDFWFGGGCSWAGGGGELKMRSPWLSRSGRVILIFISCFEAQKKFLAKDTDPTPTVPREGTGRR